MYGCVGISGTAFRWKRVSFTVCCNFFTSAQMVNCFAHSLIFPSLRSHALPTRPVDTRFQSSSPVLYHSLVYTEVRHGRPTSASRILPQLAVAWRGASYTSPQPHADPKMCKPQIGAWLFFNVSLPAIAGHGASAIAIKKCKLHPPHSGMYNNGVACMAEAVVTTCMPSRLLLAHLNFSRSNLSFICMTSNK